MRALAGPGGQAIRSRPRRFGDLLVEHRGLLQEGDHVVAVGGPQRRRPALVLLEQAGEALPARLGELELRAVTVEDLDLLPLVREQDLLELGLLLDVALLACPA